MLFSFGFSKAKRLDLTSFPTRNVLLATKIWKMPGIAKQNGENVENAIKLQIEAENNKQKNFSLCLI